MANLKKNSVLLVFLLTFMICIFGYSGAVQPTLNVSAVVHANGMFRETGNRQWLETGISSKSPRFNFAEINRTSDAIFLLDSSRNLRIEMNLRESITYFSDSTRTRVALYPIVFSIIRGHATSQFYRIRVDRQCLQSVLLENGSFSPELLPCTTSAAQQWNIIERTFGGVTTYRLMGLLPLMRKANPCLKGADRLTNLVTFERCDTSNAQRWLNLKLNTPNSSFNGISILGINENYCVGTSSVPQPGPRYRRDEDGVLIQENSVLMLSIVPCSGSQWNIQLLF